jgi:hypothetical protein
MYYVANVIFFFNIYFVPFASRLINDTKNWYFLIGADILSWEMI